MATFSSVHDATDHTGIPGVGAPADITDIDTAETDTALRLAPDGAGGVEWAATSGGISSGTAFPGSPADNDLFYRTDLPCGLYRYEATGTMWLCATLHEVAWSVRNAIATGGISATTASMGNAPTLMSDGDMWVEDLIGALFVNTTNTGAAYWTIEVNKLDSANAATQIGQISTISNAADTWVEERVAIDAIVAGSAHKAFRWGVTKVSTPGNIFPIITMTWRHVVDV
jgi:hypothetical protein